MDYQEIDREMSSFVVICKRGKTLFFVSDNPSESATDIWDNARRYRYEDRAGEAMARARSEFAWPWYVVSVPEAINLRAEHTQ